MLLFSIEREPRVMMRALCYQLTWLTILGLLCNLSRAADGLVFSGFGLAPHTRVVEGGTLVVTAKVGNSGDQPAQARLVATIEELPRAQGVRHIVLQPGQSEQFELSIPLPVSLEPHERIQVVATLFVREGDRDVIWAPNGQPAIRAMTLGVKQGKTMGIVMAPDAPQLPSWFWPQPIEHAGYDLAAAARVDAGRERTSATFGPHDLPLNQFEWDEFDLFVIADPKTLQDAAAVQALRHFMDRGGRLWIMLDQIPTDLVRPLLNRDQLCEEVERIELNEFEVDIPLIGSQFYQSELQVISDRDIPLVRVVHSGGQELLHVDGWPAAISMQIGYGQLLLTTLGSQAWIEPRGAQTSPDLRHQADEQTRPWATKFAIEANAPRVSLPLTPPVDYPGQLIGDPVVPRNWVALALLAFCGSLLGLGWWLARTDRLTWLGIMAPALALVTSLCLLLAASWVRHDIPESVARLQIVDIGDHGDVASIREQASVALSSVSSMHLASTVDGLMRPSEMITSGISQFEVDDFQRWQVTNPAWPPGVWNYRSEIALPTTGLVVEGHLSDQGLTLKLPDGLPSEIEDPVLNFVIGDYLLCRTNRSELQVDNHTLVEAGRWIAGSLISDEQRRRMEIYQQFFQADNRLQRPTPRLYGWTAPWKAAAWDHPLQPRGSAMVALPVELQPPPLGTEIFLPHGLILLRRNVSLLGTTSAFDDRTGQWGQSISTAAVAEMEFCLPPEVVPFAATSLELQLDITAPQRLVTISIATAAGPIELVQLNSPSLPWSQTVTQPEILKAAEDGRLEVVVTVGQQESNGGSGFSSSVATWEIAHFHASLRGSCLPRSRLSKANDLP